VAQFRIVVIVLVAKSSKCEDLGPLIPKVLTALSDAKVGTVVRIPG
jgi:hypothetical protein